MRVFGFATEGALVGLFKESGFVLSVESDILGLEIQGVGEVQMGEQEFPGPQGFFGVVCEQVRCQWGQSKGFAHGHLH